MTNDSDIFETSPGKGRLPLYGGKMIWQFQHDYAKPTYWVGEDAGRCNLLGKCQDKAQLLSYQTYRLSFRDIARNTDTRTLISAILAPKNFCGNKLPTVLTFNNGHRTIDTQTQLFLCGVWNSFTLDWVIRKKVTTTLNFFYLYQLPIPRLTPKDPDFLRLAERAARLVGTAPEFDDLLKEVFGNKATHGTHGVTDPMERQQLRAEIDALVARLYDLTVPEFAHILSTFPLVDESVKVQTLNTFRELTRLGKFS